MIILFIDTEFTDFKDCDLISIGLVSECGQYEFYAEIVDHEIQWQSDFVKQVVVPLLDNEKYGMSYDKAGQSLAAWINQLPDQKVCVVADYPMDLHLFSELLYDQSIEDRVITRADINHAFLLALHERGIHMPQQMHQAFRQVPVGIEQYYQIDNRRHHALVDAKANRYGWLKGLEHAGRT